MCHWVSCVDSVIQFLEMGTLADKLDGGSKTDGAKESTFMRRQKRTKRYQDFYMVSAALMVSSRVSDRLGRCAWRDRDWTGVLNGMDGRDLDRSLVTGGR